MSGDYYNAELETPAVARGRGLAGRAARRTRWSASARHRPTTGPPSRSSRSVTGSTRSPTCPGTAKDELRAAQAEAAPGQPLGPQQAVDLANLVQIVSSSGTTGRPLYYGLTRRDVDTWAETCAQTFYTAGFRPGDVVAHLRRPADEGAAGGLPYADGFRRLGAALAWVGGFPTERILAALPSLQASGLLAANTSSALYLVEAAERLTGAPASALGIRKLQLGGEPGLSSPNVRAMVETGWGTSHVREGMGLADVLAAMWSECDAKAGMHFNGQRAVVIELVDPEDGSRIDWTEGARSKIVYTTFEREATPVVRYRSADHVVVTGVDCACQRASPGSRSWDAPTTCSSTRA